MCVGWPFFCFHSALVWGINPKFLGWVSDFKLHPWKWETCYLIQGKSNLFSKVQPQCPLLLLCFFSINFLTLSSVCLFLFIYGDRLSDHWMYIGICSISAGNFSVVRVEMCFLRPEYLLCWFWLYDVIVIFHFSPHFNTLSTLLRFINFISKFSEVLVSQCVNWYFF